jgi:hypothetical protein
MTDRERIEELEAIVKGLEAEMNTANRLINRYGRAIKNHSQMLSEICGKLNKRECA